MNALENSLCGSCEHLIYCSLTNDKSFIWSCSEYSITKGHNVIFDSIIKDAKGFSTSGNNKALV